MNAAVGVGVDAPAGGVYCDQCGTPAEAGGHKRCAARRALEPPRYCADCGRRMVVQVTPRLDGSLQPPR